MKAFHLVKNEPDSLTSKGYCFVEYVDSKVTPVAVLGLNGMDLGGGKVLSVRIAGERSDLGIMAPPAASSMGGVSVFPPPPSAPRPEAIIIDGYDVEVLVDAAMGLRAMPTAPMHVDQFGMPITRAVPVLAVPGAILRPAPTTLPSSLPTGASALDIANAALDAAMGRAMPAAPTTSSSRILVLLNMVTDEDLATDDEYQGLLEEVGDECAKFGNLLGMKIPRVASANVQPSAIRKIFLEYATVNDAANAERELAGRQFGPNVVQVRF